MNILLFSSSCLFPSFILVFLLRQPNRKLRRNFLLRHKKASAILYRCFFIYYILSILSQFSNFSILGNYTYVIRSLITFNIFFSNRDTWTWLIPNSFAISVWVLSLKYLNSIRFFSFSSNVSMISRSAI